MGEWSFHIQSEDSADLFTVEGNIVTCNALELRNSQNRTSLGIYFKEKRTTWEGLFDTFIVRSTDGDEQLGQLEKFNERDWKVLGRDGKQAASAKKNDQNYKFLKAMSKQRFKKRFGRLPETHNFIFSLGNRKIGSLAQKEPYTDQYELDLSGDTYRQFDRRLALALAILLVCKEYLRAGAADEEADRLREIVSWSVVDSWSHR